MCCRRARCPAARCRRGVHSPAACCHSRTAHMVLACAPLQGKCPYTAICKHVCFCWRVCAAPVQRTSAPPCLPAAPAHACAASRLGPWALWHHTRPCRCCVLPASLVASVCPACMFVYVMHARTCTCVCVCVQTRHQHALCACHAGSICFAHKAAQYTCMPAPQPSCVHSMSCPTPPDAL